MLNVDIKKRFEIDGNSTLNLQAAFTVKDGITVLFGPSGSGKTTILNAIAGIVTPDEGKIELGNQVYFDSATKTNLPIRNRRVGFVFQDYALFPHLTAESNVSYGIKTTGDKSKREIARQMLSLLGIEQKANHYPKELSGGERQRVALARALASDPAILLLDEPLSAVDASTRMRLLEEMNALQKKLNIPFIYVTHNQGEAVRIGDCVFILHQGQILQKGIPLDVFNAPKNLATARIVGTENLFLGRIKEHKPDEGITTVSLGGLDVEASYTPLPVGTEVTLGIRSEDVIISCEPNLRTSARNVLEGMIKDILSDGEKAELVVACGMDFKVSVTLGTIKELKLMPGAKVYLLIKARAFHFLS